MSNNTRPAGQEVPWVGAFIVIFFAALVFLLGGRYYMHSLITGPTVPPTGAETALREAVAAIETHPSTSAAPLTAVALVGAGYTEPPRDLVVAVKGTTRDGYCLRVGRP